jgi:hypothetical protein
MRSPVPRAAVPLVLALVLAACPAEHEEFPFDTAWRERIPELLAEDHDPALDTVPPLDGPEAIERYLRFEAMTGTTHRFLNHNTFESVTAPTVNWVRFLDRLGPWLEVAVAVKNVGNRPVVFESGCLLTVRLYPPEGEPVRPVWRGGECWNGPSRTVRIPPSGPALYPGWYLPVSIPEILGDSLTPGRYRVEVEASMIPVMIERVEWGERHRPLPPVTVTVPAGMVELIPRPVLHPRTLEVVVELRRAGDHSPADGTACIRESWRTRCEAIQRARDRAPVVVFPVRWHPGGEVLVTVTPAEGYVLAADSPSPRVIRLPEGEPPLSQFLPVTFYVLREGEEDPRAGWQERLKRGDTLP